MGKTTSVTVEVQGDVTPDELRAAQTALQAVFAGAQADTELLKALKNPLAPHERARARQQFTRLQKDYADWIMAEMADAELYFKALPKMLMGRGGEEELRRLQEVKHKLIRRKLNPVIRTFYTAALQCGLRAGGADRAPTDNELNLVERLRLNEYAYLDNFITDMKHGEGVMDYGQRAGLYVNAIEEAYWIGYTYGDLSADRFVRWTSHPAEHCLDCAYLSGNVAVLSDHGVDLADAQTRMGFPPGGRWGNGVYQSRELAAAGIFPQSGTLTCTTRCKCSLVPAKKPTKAAVGKPLPQPFHSLEQKEFTGKGAREHDRDRRAGYERRAVRNETRYHPRTEERRRRRRPAK